MVHPSDPRFCSYLEAHDTIRSITGLGAGNGPYIAIHDGFQGVETWAGFLPGADRMILDTHPYFAFDGTASTAPIVPNGGEWPGEACSNWASGMNTRCAIILARPAFKR
jgi:glucan 1,3-beta-glucosidase